MKGFYVILITAFLLGIFAAQGKNAKARRVNDLWIFPPIIGLKIVYIVVAILGVGLIILGYFGPQKDQSVVCSGGLMFAIFACVTWPKAIVLSESSIRQRSWRGCWKTIGWCDLLPFETKRDGSVIIRSRSCRIVHSPYHAGHDLFIAEIKGRSGKSPSAIPLK
jgi:hypothetical protein